jgi:mono/diheme cytochrome c family protein
VQCHGAPGVAPEPFALGMTPAPAALVHTARTWTLAEIFWVVKEGIKMTGMPAWKYRMSEDDMWAVVAFLPAMARLTPRRTRPRPGSSASR